MEAKPKNGRRDLEKERFWRELMAQRQRNSGQSVHAFCKEAGVTEGRFYHWQRELRKRDGAQALPGFTEVIRRAPCAPSRSSGVSLELTGGQKILLARDFDVAVLRTVMDVLEGTVCT